MKKTEINICDECKERIAKKKCVICDTDICDSCLEDLDYPDALLDFESNGEPIFEDDEAVLCSKCSKEVASILHWRSKFIKQIFKELDLKNILFDKIKTKVMNKRALTALEKK